jgi:hypothetical protein
MVDPAIVLVAIRRVLARHRSAPLGTARAERGRLVSITARRRGATRAGRG